ncbi:hypothetical protein ASPBRDRAFT_112951 [Aspergillus brasiliensis CBS 101740]|uniref:Xylanolytic transcriptional activator regulatory domain-containing protein n=1 Tax=Aspergillus brasiliensis (strain CBS 101740 / IMI 381727 / IBT 21946) TaxID=767769 RepID=A0A1L9V186_ASPBC|nr:hypothetical protein ASPBRDRAFT_112951 [Aspergillus brasiliensis CBS 101740]
MVKRTRLKAEIQELRARRKSKCSGTAPCSYCSRTKKRCRFERVPSRTPLTRKNLEEKEQLCEKLTKLIRHLNPNVDIEEALKALPGAEEGRVNNETAHDSSPCVSSDAKSPTPLESFEWNEGPLTLSHLPTKSLDGMASLPTKGSGSGYLGNSSGSCILETISDLLPEHPVPLAARRGSLPANSTKIGRPELLRELDDSILVNSLFDAYFTWYNKSFPILHEKTFREKYQNRHHIPAHSTWYLIFYIVLAIGDWVVSGGSKVEESRYYMAARSCMSMNLLESGALITVQAFLLMGNFLQKRDRPNTGYNFIGIAYRMALGLGLHREPMRESMLDTLSSERRRVVWWIVYSFDSGFSLTTGRPLMSSDSFIETQLPRNIEDSASSLDSKVPDPVDKPTTYSAIIAQARLARIGNMIYCNVIAGPKKDLDFKTPRSLDHQLKAWRLSLPPFFTAHDVPTWFRGPRAIVSWKEQNLRMMLWWGTQRLSGSLPDSEEARNMCHYAAVECIQDITTFCLDYPETLHVGLCWYATYFLFQASVVLSIYHLRPKEPLDRSLARANEELWRSSIERSRDCLANLSQKNQAAARCLEVLDRIMYQSQATPHAVGEASSSTHDPGTAQLPMEYDNTGTRLDTLAVDPSLQMLFDATSFDMDIFEGLEGFPNTNEVESFDYVSGAALVTDSAENWQL